MTQKSKVASGKGMALAGAAVAAVIVLIGLLFSARMAPQVPVVETGAPAPAALQPQTAGEAEPTATDGPATAVATEDPSEEATAEEEVAETPAAETPAADDAPAAEATAGEATQAPAAEATAEEAAQAPAAPLAPSFDTVRVAPDGEALIAGRGTPGRTVEVLLDGQGIGQAVVGPDGAFVAFLSLVPSDQPRVLTLRMPAADGADSETILSSQQVIIAPVAAPVAVAEGGTTTTPDTPAHRASEEAAAPAAAPALLLADGSGLRVLQPATPANPSDADGIALDMISYTAEGDVLLQGRATADQTVLAYLDNRSVTSARVGPDGFWTTGLPGVRPGLYTLRLDEVDPTGRVLSRIETPFKREDRAEVAAIAAAGAPVAASDPVASPTETGATTGAAPAEEVASATEEAPGGAPSPVTPSPVTPAVRVVTVQPGNTLWAIARENYGEGPLFVRVFNANRDRIRDPDLIYPGQIFEIPE